MEFFLVINSKDEIEYRDLVQISSDVEKLVTNLFRLNQGYIGKVGISKAHDRIKLLLMFSVMLQQIINL